MATYRRSGGKGIDNESVSKAPHLLVVDRLPYLLIPSNLTVGSPLKTFLSLIGVNKFDLVLGIPNGRTVLRFNLLDSLIRETYYIQGESLWLL